MICDQLNFDTAYKLCKKKISDIQKFDIQIKIIVDY